MIECQAGFWADFLAFLACCALAMMIFAVLHGCWTCAFIWPRLPADLSMHSSRVCVWGWGMRDTLLAFIRHHGCRFLCWRPRGENEPCGVPETFNTDQTLAVHELRVYTNSQRGRGTYFNGWPRSLDGQRDDRMPLAFLKYEYVYLRGRGREWSSPRPGLAVWVLEQSVSA